MEISRASPRAIYPVTNWIRLNIAVQEANKLTQQIKAHLYVQAHRNEAVRLCESVHLTLYVCVIEKDIREGQCIPLFMEIVNRVFTFQFILGRSKALIIPKKYKK
jgi:hypothetical protein